MGRRQWHGWAVEVEAESDGQPDGQRATLTVRLDGEDGTPPQQIGRLINVVLTAPMLEELARVAQDTGAAYYVEITNPTARLYEPTIELGPLEDGESPCGPSL